MLWQPNNKRKGRVRKRKGKRRWKSKDTDGEEAAQYTEEGKSKEDDGYLEREDGRAKPKMVRQHNIQEEGKSKEEATFSFPMGKLNITLHITVLLLGSRAGGEYQVFSGPGTSQRNYNSFFPQ